MDFNLILIILYALFFIITFKIIFGASKVFGFVYILLFVYSFFTMIGYNYYSKEFVGVSAGQYYGQEIFNQFYSYILFSLITIFLFFVVFYTIRIDIRVEMQDSNNFNRAKQYLFYIVCLLYFCALAYFLIKNYNDASYQNRLILKGNKIWSYLYSSCGVFFIILISKIISAKNNVYKLLDGIAFTLIFSVTIITAYRVGQRIEIFACVIAILLFSVVYYDINLNIKSLVKHKKVVAIFSLFILFSQVVRNTRGGLSSLTEVSGLKLVTSLFDLKTLVFQDYSTPSITLATSMYYNIVIPLEIIKGNIYNIFSFLTGGYPVIGETLSRVVDPNGKIGYGYYILTEGYNTFGFMGFIYISFLVVAVYKIYEDVLARTGDNLYNACMSSIIGFFIIDIVRGTSLFFIKGVLYYVVPFMLLFSLAYSKSIVIKFKGGQVS